MQDPETRRKLVNLLLDISEGERQIEVLRQILCEQRNFEPYAAFQRIDTFRKNSLAVSDILEFLYDNNISHTEEYCSIFLSHYDIDSDNRLDYSEFLRVVLPSNNTALRALVTQRETYKVPKAQRLGYELECALAKVIDKEISFYLKIDAQKLELTRSPNYSSLDAFTLVDVNGSGRISFSNLKQFFQKEEVYPTDEEILAVLKRIDRDGDGLAPYEDFIEALHPLDFSTNTLVERLKTTTALSQSPMRSSYKGATSVMKTTSASYDTKYWGTVATDSSPIREFEASAKMYASADRPGKMTMSMLKPEEGTRYSPKMAIGRDKSLNKTMDMTRGVLNKHYPGTASPGKYRKEASPFRREASPYRKAAVYSEKIKQSREYGSGKRREGEYIEDRKEERSHKGNVSSFESRLNHSYKSTNVYRREKSPRGKSGKKDSGLKRRESFESENCKAVLDIFRHFVYLDKEIERIKKQLALQLDFNLFSLFRCFDVQDRGRVDSKDIENGMQKYGIYPDREELYLFMRRFDRKNLEQLVYGDFIEIFRPLQYESLNVANSRILKSPNKSSDPNQIFNTETKGLIRKVLDLHLENERSAETLRQNLQKRASFNPRQAFNSLDKNGDGYLTIESIMMSCEEHGMYLMKKKYELLMNRLDHNQQGKISYVDFVNEINPKS